MKGISRLRLLACGALTVFTVACSTPQQTARLCGITGFVLGGYVGAAGLRSIDSGSDWDSALTGGFIGAFAVGAGSYFLCKWLAGGDEGEAAQEGAALQPQLDGPGLADHGDRG